MTAGHLYASADLYYAGKLGYMKMLKGVSSDTVSGAPYQPSHVGLINTGSKIFAERKLGTVSIGDMNQSYDEFGVIDPNGTSTSIVDSNDIYLMFDHTISGTKGQSMQLKVNMSRASATDIGAVKGIGFTFSK
jgi:hypothetical protein